MFSASTLVGFPPTVSASQGERGKMKTSATVSGPNVNDSILNDNPEINRSEVEPSWTREWMLRFHVWHALKTDSAT